MLAASQIAVDGATSALLQTELAVIFDSGTSNIVLDTNYTEVRPASFCRPSP